MVEGIKTCVTENLDVVGLTVVLGVGDREEVTVLLRTLGVVKIVMVDPRTVDPGDTVIVEDTTTRCGELEEVDRVNVTGSTVVTVEETTTTCGATDVVFGAVVEGVIVTGTTVIMVEDVMIGVGAGCVKTTGTTAREVEEDVM